MNYYQHHRSNSLLQRAYMLRNNTLALASNDNNNKLKRDNSQKHLNSNSLLESSKNNDSYSDSEALKDKILSPQETSVSTYDTPIKSKTTELLFNSIGRSQSFTNLSTQRVRKTLILDLDETLVHSSFRPFNSKSDIELQVIFDDVRHRVYVLKRPYVDEFLQRMNELYDIFVFTASISSYANPLLDTLDRNRVIKKRLFREHCKGRNGAFIKDLSVVGKELKDMILLDNNPISYNVNQLNGMPIPTWHDDKNDTELLKLIPLLEYMATIEDVRRIISKVVLRHKVDYYKVNDLIAVNQLHTPKKKDPKIEIQIIRSKSSNLVNYANTYENKLQEWTKLKKKMEKNNEELQRQDANNSINTCTTCLSTRLSDKSLDYYEDNKHYLTIRKMIQNPTIVKAHYYTEHKPKYNEDLGNGNSNIYNNNNSGDNNKTNYNRSNYSNSQMYSNPAVNFLQSKYGYNTIEHLSNFYQTSSSFYQNRQMNLNNINTKDLKRNTSCTCFKPNQDNDIGINQLKKNINRRTNPLKANQSECYRTNEEEEKSFFNKASYNTNRNLYSSSSNFRNSFNPNNDHKSEEYLNDNSNPNYYSVRRMMINKNCEDKRMKTPTNINNRYNDIDNDNRLSMVANNNKRLLFNSSALGSDYRSEYFLNNREYNNSEMRNTLNYIQ